MKKLRKLTVIAVLITASITLLWYLDFSNKRTFAARVKKLEKIEMVEGSQEGAISTKIYYLVYTDAGTFRINIQGFLAHPELTGILKEDSLYKITVCGIEVPYWGRYRNLIEVRSHN